MRYFPTTKTKVKEITRASYRNGQSTVRPIVLTNAPTRSYEMGIKRLMYPFHGFDQTPFTMFLCDVILSFQS